MLQIATNALQSTVLGLYALAQVMLVIYSTHRYVTLVRWWKGRARGEREGPRQPANWPHVTVQLPLYNERLVAERLIDAVAALDYPRDRFEIQVLDDSSDETTSRAADAVARARATGVDAHLIHRDDRAGFKAGALESGLREARGEFIAVFDADFIPRSDFLRRVIPHFAAPDVGMVQARWGHLNRRRSPLTSAQAVMLDSHFLLEHVVRMERGLFFNFNGTAGVWRRTCVESSGGWSHETLTEDLDLSYRAQLRGWRFVFDAAVESPAELPVDMAALKSQQRRWTKGSVQTARKLLPALWRSALPWRVKIEALVHLTSNFTYPLLLGLGLLLLPVMLGTSLASPLLVWGLHIAVIGFGVVPVAIFLTMGQWIAGERGWRVPFSVAAALVLGVGLSVNNARAVIEGFGPRVGRWERTPKSGDGTLTPALAPYMAAGGPAGRAEAVLSAYFAALGVFAWARGDYHALPFIALLLAGFALVAFESLRSTRPNWQ